MTPRVTVQVATIQTEAVGLVLGCRLPAEPSAQSWQLRCFVVNRRTSAHRVARIVRSRVSVVSRTSLMGSSCPKRSRARANNRFCAERLMTSCATFRQMSPACMASRPTRRLKSVTLFVTSTYPSSTACRTIIQSPLDPRPSHVTCIDSRKPRLRASVASSGLRHSSIRNFTQRAGDRQNGPQMTRVRVSFATGERCAVVHGADRHGSRLEQR